MGLEGIVSKRLGSRYVSGRTRDWLKMKNPAAPAVKREAAMAAFASWLLSPQPPLRIQLARRAGLRRRPEHPNVHPVPTGAPVARLAPRHRLERPRRLHEVAHTTRHLRQPPRPRRLPFQARRLRGPTAIDRSKLRHVALHQ